LTVTGSGGISSDTFGSGNGGSVAIQAGTLAIGPDGEITTDTAKSGNGGSIAVTVTGALSIDGTSSTISTGITALTVTGSTGNAGNIIVNAGSLTIGPNGQITTDTFGTGKGGNIAVTVAGALSIDGTSSSVPTGITALTGSNGDAGNVAVNAGSLSIVNNGVISVDTLGNRRRWKRHGQRRRRFVDRRQRAEPFYRHYLPIGVQQRQRRRAAGQCRVADDQ